MTDMRPLMTDTQQLGIRLSWISIQVYAWAKKRVVSFCGNAGPDGADGHPLMPAAGRVRERELDPSPSRPRRLATPDGPYAGRSGSVRRASGQYGRARTRARPKTGGGSRGRSRGDFSTQIRLLMDRQGRPLNLRVTGGPRHDRTQAWAPFAA